MLMPLRASMTPIRRPTALLSNLTHGFADDPVVRWVFAPDSFGIDINQHAVYRCETL